MSSFNPDLQAIVRIKRMAEAAANIEPSPFTAEQVIGAYERLRGEAKALNKRAFDRDDDSFDQELSPMPEEEGVAGYMSGPPTGVAARRAFARGEAARVLRGQLAAWAAGLRDTFEIEARMKADAQARAAGEKPKGPVGFK